MAEVGVLNLTIKDNSTSAANGLNKLTDALSRVKTAVQGVDLTPVATSLTKLSATINEAKGTSTTIKNLATLFNAIEKFTKIKKFNIPTEPFKNLREALGEGFKIGTAGTQLNALREAMTGDWGDGSAIQMMKDLSSVAQSYGDKSQAENIRSMAGAVKEMGDAVKAANKASSAAGDWRMGMSGVKAQAEAVREQVEAAKEWTKLPVNLSQFGRKKDKVIGGEQLQMDFEGMAKEAAFEKMTAAIDEVFSHTTKISESLETVAGGFREATQAEVELIQTTEAGLHKASDAAGELVIRLQEIGDTITSIQTTRFEDMYRMFSELAYDFKWFNKETMRLQSGMQQMLLGAGETPLRLMGDTANMLSTWVDMSAAWQPDWGTGANWKPDWVSVASRNGEGIEGEGWIHPDFDTEAMREYLDLLKEIHAYTTTPSARGTWDDIADGAAQANTQAEAFYHTMERTNEIIRQTAWSAGAMYESFRNAFNAWSDLRSAMSLGSGVSGFLGSGAGQTETGWQQYNPWGGTAETGWTYWKDGAIEVEGTVEDAEAAIGRLTSAATLALPAGEQNVFGSIEEMARHLGITVEEATQKLRETWTMLQKAGGEGMLFSSLEEAAKYYGMTLDELKEKMLASVGNQQTPEAFVNAMEQVARSTDMTANRLDLLREKARLLRQEIESGKTLKGNILDDKAINSRQLQLEAVLRQIEKLEAKAAEASMPKTDYRVDYGQELVENLVNQYSNIDLLNLKLGGMKQALADDINANKIDTQQMAERAMAIQNLQQKIDELTAAQERANSLIGRMSTIWSDMKNGIKSMFPTLTGMIKRFGQIAKYRMLRSVLRYITAGFSEGVQNVYHYSKLVGTELAPAMDSAATSFQQLKNSIGAAVSPLITAFIPVVNQVVSVVITAINYLNQFFALLNGQSQWTRALPAATTAFDAQKKAAGGASKAMKDLLADWDELNIIQSESGGGGGGGGGKTATDYGSMFEQVNDFDKKVKDVFGFIDEYLGGIWGLVKKIGAIILGWKLSKAFSGFLGTLGKLIAGGALLKLGLELAYGSSFEAGKKGFFDTADLIGTIAGNIAGAVGGAVISTALGLGGGVGFVIGLVGGIVVDLVGWNNGRQDTLDRMKWGDIEWTTEQIKEHVRKQFTFDVDAEIEVMKGHIKNEEEAKKAVTDAVNEFSSSLSEANSVMADINTTTAEDKINAIKKAAEDAESAINAVKHLIDTNEEGLKFTLTNFKFTNENGEDISADLLSQLSVANTTLRDYFTNMGKELADLLLAGEKSGWKNGEAEAAIAMMQSQKRIYDRAQELSDQMSFEGSSKARLTEIQEGAKSGTMSRDTAIALWEEQKTALNNYVSTAKEKVKQEANDLYYFAGLSQAAANELLANNPDSAEAKAKAKELQDAADTYKASADAIMADLDQAVNDRIAETKKNMIREWAETLSVVYGSEYDSYTEGILGGDFFTIDWNDVFNEMMGWGDYATGTFDKHNVELRGVKQTAEALRNKLITLVTDAFNDYDGLGDYYVNDLGGNIFELFSEDARKQLLANMKEKLGDSSLAEEIFKEAFGLTQHDLDKYTTPTEKEVEESVHEFTDKVTHVFESESQTIQNAIKEAMKDGVMSTDESMQIMLDYGFEEYSNAMEELQYNLDEEGRNLGKLKNKNMANKLDTNNQIASAGISDSWNKSRTGKWNKEPGKTYMEDELIQQIEESTADPVQLDIQLDPVISMDNADLREEVDSVVAAVQDELNLAAKSEFTVDVSIRITPKMMGVDAFVQAQPYINKVVDSYREWLDLAGRLSHLYSSTGMFNTGNIAGIGTGMMNGYAAQSAVNPNVASGTKVEAEIDGTQMANSVNRGVALPLGQLNATNSTTNSLLAQLVNICSQIARSGGSSTLAKNGSYIRSALGAYDRQVGDTSYA